MVGDAKQRQIEQKLKGTKNYLRLHMLEGWLFISSSA